MPISNNYVLNLNGLTIIPYGNTLIKSNTCEIILALYHISMCGAQVRMLILYTDHESKKWRSINRKTRDCDRTH